MNMSYRHISANHRAPQNKMGQEIIPAGGGTLSVSASAYKNGNYAKNNLPQLNKSSPMTQTNGKLANVGG